MALASGKKKALMGIGMGLLLLTACTPQIDYRGYQPREGAFDQLSQGMSKAEVEALLGSPSTTATITTAGDSYYYISSKTETTAFYAPVEIERRVLAIRFNTNDQVTSFASYGLQDGKVVAYNSEVTPTKGRELTILQQLLINAGRFGGTATGPGAGGIIKP